MTPLPCIPTASGRPRRRPALGALCVAGLALWPLACRTPLEEGERRYREGDRLGALETWRAVEEGDPSHAVVRERIAVVEDESEQLVVRYKQRARYFEERDRLAEAILDDRLALRLQPDDQETRQRVQELARSLAERKGELRASYVEARSAGELAAARDAVVALRALDPFDPELVSDERSLQAALRAEVERRLASGQRAFAGGNHAAARRELRAALALDPENESARGYLSYLATLEREAAGDTVRYEPPDPFGPDSSIRAEGFYQNALAAERAGNDFAAIRLDILALRADPEHRRARQHLGRMRARLTDEVEPLIERGREAFQNEDLQGALDYWRMVLLIEPQNERTRAYVARAERQLSNLERLRSDPDVSTAGN